MRRSATAPRVPRTDVETGDDFAELFDKMDALCARIDAQARHIWVASFLNSFTTAGLVIAVVRYAS